MQQREQQPSYIACIKSTFNLYTLSLLIDTIDGEGGEMDFVLLLTVSQVLCSCEGPWLCRRLGVH